MKALFLFRHGDKEMSMQGNPELSKTGRAQGLALKNKVEAGVLPTPTRLWVSPKIRTQQSFQELGKFCGLALEPLEDLLERKRSETPKDFDQRIQRVLHLASQQTGVVFLCTHYDWLEDAGAFLDFPQAFSWHPMSFLGFEWVDGAWVNMAKGQIIP